MTVSWLQLPPSSSMRTLLFLDHIEFCDDHVSTAPAVFAGEPSMRGTSWASSSGLGGSNDFFDLEAGFRFLHRFSSWPLGSSSDFRLYLAYDVVRWVPKHQVEPSFSNLEIEGWEGQSHGDRKQDSSTFAQRSNENRPSQHSPSHANPKRCLNLSWLDSQVIAVISLSASNSCIRGQATSFLTIFAHKTQVSKEPLHLPVSNTDTNNAYPGNNSCAGCQLDWSLLSLANFKVKKLERIYESAPLRHRLSICD